MQPHTTERKLEKDKPCFYYVFIDKWQWAKQARINWLCLGQGIAYYQINVNFLQTYFRRSELWIQPSKKGDTKIAKRRHEDLKMT